MSHSALLIWGIILLSANLRPAITGVGPLVEIITRQTGLPSAIAGILTTLPLIAFGVVSPISPSLVRKFGMERSLFLGLVVLTIGTLLRSWGSVFGLMIGMFLVGSGAAIENVLLPSLVKRDFPSQIGLVTGLYSSVMNVFAALASGISVPLSLVARLGWRGSLASWAVLSLLAMAVWLPQLKRRHGMGVHRPTGAWRSAVAWQITFFMGLQSLLFYVNVAWLPTLLHDRGMSLGLSGWMVSLMQFVSLPSTFVVPIIAVRRKNQQGLVGIISLLFALGYLGLLLPGTRFAWLWVTLIGVAGGASISLALAFFGLRSHHHEQAAELSGMAQSVGYLLAAIGPISIGLIHHATKTWSLPLLALLVTVGLMLVSGLGAGRNVYVQSRSPIP